MSWTKRELIEMAFEEVGIANYNFDLMPEQYQSGLKRLDSMLAQWNKKGIRIGYNLASSPSDSNINDESNVRDSAVEAIYINLALRLASSLGKIVSMELKALATKTYKDLLSETSEIVERDFTQLPKGAGNKPWRYNYNTFLNQKVEGLSAGNDAEITA